MPTLRASSRTVNIYRTELPSLDRSELPATDQGGELVPFAYLRLKQNTGVRSSLSQFGTRCISRPVRWNLTGT